jgi:hypothetical protein
MSNIQAPDSYVDLPLAIIKNMIGLSTSGFGVVVALAWNQVIQEIVKKYISPYFGGSSGLVSLLIYAILVTLLAVIVTMHMAKVEKQLTEINQKIIHKPKQKKPV